MALTARVQLVYARCDDEGVELLPECPFHRDNDLLLPHHEAQVRHRQLRFRCALCERTFSSRLLIDQHQAEEHADVLADEGVCLADLCDVLLCPSSAASFYRSTAPAICQPVEMARRQHECEVHAASRACEASRSRRREG